LRRAAILFWRDISRRLRDSFTRGAIRSGSSNDVVPSSSENVKTPTLSNCAASTKASSSSKSPSVSPGKPTMNDVRTATPGTRWRMRSTIPSRWPFPVGRFIRFSTDSLACWRGMSTYFTTRSSPAIASRTGSLSVAG
jgi:hypothetical protein